MKMPLICHLALIVHHNEIINEKLLWTTWGNNHRRTKH